MNNTLKTIVWITAAIAVVSLGVAAVLFFATGMGEPWQRGSGVVIDDQKSFALSGIGELDVRTSSTDLYITASRGDTVEIRLHGTVYAAHPDSIPTLAAEQSGAALEITTVRRDGKRWALGFFSSDLILEIRVPKQYRSALIVNTSSGDVEITDQNLSELAVATSSGTIQLHSVQAATVVMDSSSGDQTAENLQAEYSELTSSSGEIRVRDLQGGVKAESSSGDITLRYREFSSNLEVRSSSGDVELHLTESAEFKVEARASSGDIDCAFPVTLTEADSEIRSNRLYGTVGEGTHRISVRTSSGDITIRP
jgi:lia operon protein LiaG